jgi:hypothetical protein
LKLTDSIRLSLLILILLCFGGCSLFGGDFVKTKDIVFYCEPGFNEGQLLPVDLIFIKEAKDLATISKQSPDDWFSSTDREKWMYKQSLKFRQGDYTKKKIVVKVPKKTINVVLYADFYKLTGPDGQQLLLDASSKKEISVFISSQGILHHSDKK